MNKIESFTKQTIPVSASAYTRFVYLYEYEQSQAKNELSKEFVEKCANNYYFDLAIGITAALQEDAIKLLKTLEEK